MQVGRHICRKALILQQDHKTLNQRVVGSIPTAPTKLFKYLQHYASERTFRFEVRFEKFVRHLYASALTLSQRNGGTVRVTAAAIFVPGGVERSHAEALATGERLHLDRSTSQIHLCFYPYTSLSFLIADSASSTRPPR
jgi:hypothetical protein